MISLLIILPLLPLLKALCIMKCMGLGVSHRRCGSHPPLLLHTLVLFHLRVWQQLIRYRRLSICLGWAMRRFPERRDSAPLTALEKKTSTNPLASWSKQGDTALWESKHTWQTHPSMPKPALGDPPVSMKGPGLSLTGHSINSKALLTLSHG